MEDFGADPALAKAEPVARLGPSGFDPGEWQPIETLPYGDHYLLYVPGTGVTVGHVSSGEFVIDVLNGCRETYATHWLPLPEPPNDRP